MRWWTARATACMRLQLRGGKLGADKIRGWRYAITTPATHLAIFLFFCPFAFGALIFSPLLSLSLSPSLTRALVSLMHRVRTTKMRQIVFCAVNETTQFNLHRQTWYFLRPASVYCWRRIYFSIFANIFQNIEDFLLITISVITFVIRILYTWNVDVNVVNR